mgnify:CR=1 FL=1
MKRIIIALTLLYGCSICLSAQQKVKVAAAANLRFVLEEIKKQYESANRQTDIEITFGSSGTLTQQIVNGAPFDLFMAADMEFPQKVKEQGFAAGDVKTYIYGKVALWSSTIDVKKGLKTVTLPEVKKIAIADPKKAPYGENAVAVLKKQKLYDRISSKIVWGENISQAAQYAFSGNAEIGFIALSLALAPDMKGKGIYYVLPPKICPPIAQGCVLLKHGSANGEVQKFMNYVMSKACNNIWRNFGYGLVK